MVGGCIACAHVLALVKVCYYRLDVVAVLAEIIGIPISDSEWLRVASEVTPRIVLGFPHLARANALARARMRGVIPALIPSAEVLLVT